MHARLSDVLKFIKLRTFINHYYYYISVFTEETGWQKDYVYFHQQTEYTQNFSRIIQANVLRTFGVDMPAESPRRWVSPGKKVVSCMVQGGISQDFSIMNRPRPSHINVCETEGVITCSLHI